MSYSCGGYIPAPDPNHQPAGFLLDPDECVYDHTGSCVRTDPGHGRTYDAVTVAAYKEPIRYVERTHSCRHLAAHVIPVHSGDQVVAHLCTLCDTQLRHTDPACNTGPTEGM